MSLERKELLAALNAALIESRKRWQDLVHLDADSVFETDANGLFTFLWPDTVLGWTSDELLGLPAADLLAHGGAGAPFNPFHPAEPVRNVRAWLRRGDGGAACASISSLPCRTEGGGTGSRGLFRDVTEDEHNNAAAASMLRRQALIDRVMDDIRKEALASRMAEAATAALISALGLEGAAVYVRGASSWALLAASGSRAEAMRDHLQAELDVTSGPERRHLRVEQPPAVLMPAHHPAGPDGALAAWRSAGSRDFDEEDLALIAAIAEIAGLLLAQHVMQQELAAQARTDALTGLLNRRSFTDQVEARLTATERASAILFLDLDHFKQVNDRLGHEAGDQVLRNAARMLQGFVRPGDLVARLGGDEFAVWLEGAGEEVAERRVRDLVHRAPSALAEGLGELEPPLAVSAGYAVRGPSAGDRFDELLRRADAQMYLAKRDRRRLAGPDGPPAADAPSRRPAA